MVHIFLFVKSTNSQQITAKDRHQDICPAGTQKPAETISHHPCFLLALLVLRWFLPANSANAYAQGSGDCLLAVGSKTTNNTIALIRYTEIPDERQRLLKWRIFIKNARRIK